MGKGKILIVDDERVIADSLAMIFGSNGYEVVAAYSAETAIDLFATWAPSLAIVDVYLPGMNGIELAKAMQVSMPSCRVVLFSGRAATDDSLGRSSIPFEVLPKPVHPATLLTLAEEYFSSASGDDSI